MGGGVHDSYTFQCELVGSFTSPGSWHRHQIEGTDGFWHLCSIRTHLVLRISKIENSQNVANNYSNQCVAGGGGILTGSALIRGLKLNTSKCD